MNGRNAFGYPSTIAYEGASITQRITQVLNHPLPWFVLIAIVAGTALGFSYRAQDLVELGQASQQASLKNAIELARAAQQTADARAAAAEERARSAAETASTAEREARMLQYYVIEVDGKIIKLGVDPPEGGYMKWREHHLKESGK